MSDADLAYTQSRNNQPDALDQALAEQAAPVEVGIEPETETPFLSRFVSGVGEAVLELGKGGIEGAKQMSRAVEGVLDDLDIPSVVQITNEKGEFDLDLLTREAAGEAASLFPELEKPEGFVPALARATGQFLVGFGPAFKALGALKTGVKTIAAGAVADAFAFDPFEERLANLAQDLGVDNFVTDFLATEVGDTEAEGRFSNAIEGALLGKIGEGVPGLGQIINGHDVVTVEVGRTIRVGAPQCQQGQEVLDADLAVLVEDGGARGRPRKRVRQQSDVVRV